MFKVLLSRLGQAALVMLVVSAVSFVMFRYVGDPVASMSRENASIEEKQELRRSLGLDQSVFIQYGQLSQAHALRRSRNQLPQSTSRDGVDRRAASSHHGIGDRRHFPVIGARHPARRAVCAEAQQRDGASRAGSVARRYFDADIRDGDRADPGLRGDARMAALLRPRPSGGSRLVVHRVPHVERNQVADPARASRLRSINSR